MPTSPEIVFKSVPASFRSADDIEIVASDESEDRGGDIIRASGWDLESYQAAPRILWQHKIDEPPIGKASRVWKASGRLLANFGLFAEGTSPFIDVLRRILAQDGLNTASVGFRRTKPPKNRLDEKGNYIGREFVGQELLEISLVNIPMNANAVRLKSLGIPEEFVAKLLPEGALARVEQQQRRAALDIIRARAWATQPERR